jgi:hypothetical protein
MLAYILALAVGLGSLGLYLGAFLLPEIHRKNDMIWSGVGLFYALVLWVCANRISGGVLLGQIASVSLIGWFGWETLVLRRETLPKDRQTAFPTPAELKERLQQLFINFTKGKNATNSGSSTNSGAAFNLAQLQTTLTEIVGKAKVAIDGVIGKPKKTQTTTPTPPKSTVGKTTTASVVETPPPPEVKAPETSLKETPPEVKAPETPVETPPPPEAKAPEAPVEKTPPETKNIPVSVEKNKPEAKAPETSVKKVIENDESPSTASIDSQLPETSVDIPSSVDETPATNEEGIVD